MNTELNEHSAEAIKKSNFDLDLEEDREWLMGVIKKVTSQWSEAENSHLADPEDIFQEMALKVVKLQDDPERLNNIIDLRTYLYICVKNLIINTLTPKRLTMLSFVDGEYDGEFGNCLDKIIDETADQLTLEQYSGSISISESLEEVGQRKVDADKIWDMAFDPLFNTELMKSLNKQDASVWRSILAIRCRLTGCNDLEIDKILGRKKEVSARTARNRVQQVISRNLNKFLEDLAAEFDDSCPDVNILKKRVD